MIFGIDFGTTFTLISWYDNEELNFLKFPSVDSEFLPTKINNIENLKRLIANNNNLVRESFSKSRWQQRKACVRRCYYFIQIVSILFHNLLF